MSSRVSARGAYPAGLPHMQRNANDRASLSQSTQAIQRAGSATDHFRMVRNRYRLVTVMLFIVLAATFSLDCAMITKDRFGDYGDDGIYASAAKALGTGQGYRVISLPREEPQTRVPPLYPFLLSLIWRAYPQFPENIPWMMMLSVLATLSFLGVTYRYLTSMGYATRWQALIVIALVGLNWRTMLHGTSVMTEMVYAALAVVALFLVEKYEREEKHHGIGVLAGVVIGLAFLTRTSGIVLLIGLLCYFLGRRRWKQALLPIAVASLFVVAWMSWSYLNRMPGEGANAIYYSSYSIGMNQTISDLQMLNGTSRFVTILNITGKNVILLLIGSIPLACLGLRYDLPQVMLVSLVLITIILIATGFVRQCRIKLNLLCIYITLHMALHVVIPGTAYDRYIVPISPFLVFLLVSELAVLVSAITREFKAGQSALGTVTAGFIALAVIGASAVVIYSNSSAVYQSMTALRRISEVASEGRETIEWVKLNTESADILVCSKDIPYYLYTGRKTTPSFQLSKLDGVPYQSRNPDSDDITRTFLDIISESGGNYLISNLKDIADLPEIYQDTINEVLRQNPEKFVPVFESKNKNNVIYRILH